MVVRAQILEAALRVLDRDGLAGFTMVSLREESRFSHTTIYKHFESRTHIIEVLAVQWLDCIADKLQHRAQDEPGDLQQLFELLLQLKTATASQLPNRFAAFATTLQNNSHLEDGWKTRLREMAAGVLRDLGHSLDEAGREKLLDGVMAATIGFRHPSLIQRASPDALQHQLASVMTLILRGFPLPDILHNKHL